MKLYVVALLAVAGLTLGDDVTPEECTITLVGDEEMHGRLTGMGLHCLSSDMETVASIKGLTTLEGHRTYFKDLFCDRKQEIRECLAGVATKSAACQGRTRHGFLLLFHELLENFLEGGCVQEGETFAAMFTNYNFTEVPTYEDDHFHFCMHSAWERFATLMNVRLVPHSWFFLLYREVMTSKECFDEIEEGDVVLTKKIAAVLEDIGKKMKCMHPDTEIPVLCRAIDVTLPDVPRICPIKVENEAERSMKKHLLREMRWCMASTFMNEKDLKSIDNLSRGWQLMMHNCVTRGHIGKCLSQVVSLSAVCLDEAGHMTMKLAEDGLQRGLDALCNVDEGSAGGYVLYKVLNKADATIDHNAITDCVHAAHQTHDESQPHIDAANFLNLHRELKAFRRCLVGALKGDNRAVFDAHLFVSTLERNMKCLDTEREGEMVLCDGLDTTPATPLTECPFVGPHENAPPTYERLVDMATLCVKTPALELEPVGKYTTLGQFATFFKDFCERRRIVSHCIDDVTDYSKVCHDQTNHNVLRTFNDLFVDLLEKGCKQDGEVFSVVLHGLLVDYNELRESCVNATADEMKKRKSDSLTEVESSALRYALFGEFNECILRGVSDGGAFKNAYSALANELRKDLKCLHPDDGNLVRCETLITQ